MKIKQDTEDNIRQMEDSVKKNKQQVCYSEVNFSITY